MTPCYQTPSALSLCWSLFHHDMMIFRVTIYLSVLLCLPQENWNSHKVKDANTEHIKLQLWWISGLRHPPIVMNTRREMKAVQPPLQGNKRKRTLKSCTRKCKTMSAREASLEGGRQWDQWKPSRGKETGGQRMRQTGLLPDSKNNLLMRRRNHKN